MSNYARIIKDDFANGPGIRISIFFTGCRHHCENCFNQELWDFKCGKKFTDNTINTLIKLLEPDYIKGLSILGGEPFQNMVALESLVTAIKNKYPNKDIWVWTGYTFDELYSDNSYLRSQSFQKILNNIDVLVDGRYEDDKCDLTLKFRGSSNQRIIDIKKTLTSGDVVLL